MSPRKEKKVHLKGEMITFPRVVLYTACGKLKSDLVLTTDISLVTCGNCKTTSFYRLAIGKRRRKSGLR